LALIVIAEEVRGIKQKPRRLAGAEKEREMEMEAGFGQDQVELVGKIVREVCRVIKEEFPDNAAEVTMKVLVIQL
jgi:S-adenosylmethionine synthetase